VNRCPIVGCQGKVIYRDNGEVLLREAVGAPSLEVFRANMGGALGILILL